MVGFWLRRFAFFTAELPALGSGDSTFPLVMSLALVWRLFSVGVVGILSGSLPDLACSSLLCEDFVLVCSHSSVIVVGGSFRRVSVPVCSGETPIRSLAVIF